MSLCCCVRVCVVVCPSLRQSTENTYMFFLGVSLWENTRESTVSGPRVCVVQAGVGPCVLVECLVSAYSLQGRHHPKIIAGQLVSWAHNPVFSYPPFLWATCMIIIFTNSAKRRSERLRLLKGSHSPAVQPGGQRGHVHTGSPGHQSLYLETNSTVTSWGLAGRCLGVEGSVL